MKVLDVQKSGRNLKRLRKNKGLSVARLAEILDMTQAPIYLWEEGKQLPRTERLVMLSELYKVPIDEIIARKEI